MKLIFNIISYTCTSKIAPKIEAQLVPCKRRSRNDTNCLIFKDTILKTYILLLYFQNIFDKTHYNNKKVYAYFHIYMLLKYGMSELSRKQTNLGEKGTPVTLPRILAIDSSTPYTKQAQN